MDPFSGELTFDLPTALLVAGGVFAFTLARYVVISGLHYLVTYHWFRELFQPHKSNPRYPSRKQILGELKLGVSNLVNFSLFGVLILYLYTQGHTLIYHHAEGVLGWSYVAFSIAALFVIQDAYFYWAHRLLHWKPLMRWAHAPHHKFHNPSPFAAFAVHPFEGFLEVGFRPLIICVLPLHPAAIGVYVLLSFVANSIGHSGVELYRTGWSRHWFFGLFNSSTHHYVHHKYVNANFALYFTWWDKWMGTEHARYHEEFEAVAVQPQPEGGRVSFPSPAASGVLTPVSALGSGCSRRLPSLG